MAGRTTRAGPASRPSRGKKRQYELKEGLLGSCAYQKAPCSGQREQGTNAKLGSKEGGKKVWGGKKTWGTAAGRQCRSLTQRRKGSERFWAWRKKKKKKEERKEFWKAI